MTTDANPSGAATTWVVSANTCPVTCFRFLGDPFLSLYLASRCAITRRPILTIYTTYDAYWPHRAEWPLKFRIFENPRWRRPPYWTVEKIAISQQRHGTSSQHLARWCRIGPLTVPVIKRFNFVKIQDGRRPQYWIPLIRDIATTIWPTVTIFGTTTHSGPIQLNKKGSPYSITERKVPEVIPVLGSQPAGDVSHKSDSRLPLLSARPAVTPQPLRGLLPILLHCVRTVSLRMLSDSVATAICTRALQRLSPAR